MGGSKGGCGASRLAWWLMVIGAINWGLVGLGGYLGGDWNVVHMIFGTVEWLEWLVYLLVGVSGVMALFGGCKCGKCKA